MPPKRRGRTSGVQKTPVAEATKEGISVGLVTDEEEEENALGGALLEFDSGTEGMYSTLFH